MSVEKHKDGTVWSSRRTFRADLMHFSEALEQDPLFKSSVSRASDQSVGRLDKNSNDNGEPAASRKSVAS